MTKRLGLYLFELNTISQDPAKNWRSPGDRRTEYTTIKFWRDLAELLEHGKFDGIVLADKIGVHDVFRSSLKPAVDYSVQFPNNDPFILAAVLATVTRHLGISVTASTSYAQPYELARKLSTLDHFSGGRIGWNIVLSHAVNSAANFGADEQLDHAARYAKAQEFLDVVFKLWEGSWDEGAVLRDKDRGRYADGEKVHYIDHVGEFFKVKGPHLSEPSAQRTPLLYQAVASRRGLEFAGRNSEYIFTTGPTPEHFRENVAIARKAAIAAGRDPRDVKGLGTASIVVGKDAESVNRQLAEIERTYSLESFLAKQESVLDYTAFPDDTPLSEVLVRSGFSEKVVGFLADPDREVLDDRGATGLDAERRAIGDVLPRGLTVTNTVADAKAFYHKPQVSGFSVAGTPDVVVGQIEDWVENYDLDAINLRNLHAFDSVRNFVELVVPELQKRGIVRAEYEADETLRRRAFPELGSDLVNERHPAAQYRGVFA